MLLPNTNITGYCCHTTIQFATIICTAVILLLLRAAVSRSKLGMCHIIHTPNSGHALLYNDDTKLRRIPGGHNNGNIWYPYSRRPAIGLATVVGWQSGPYLRANQLGRTVGTAPTTIQGNLPHVRARRCRRQEYTPLLASSRSVVVCFR